MKMDGSSRHAAKYCTLPHRLKAPHEGISQCTRSTFETKHTRECACRVPVISVTMGVSTATRVRRKNRPTSYKSPHERESISHVRSQSHQISSNFLIVIALACILYTYTHTLRLRSGNGQLLTKLSYWLAGQLMTLWSAGGHEQMDGLWIDFLHSL